MKHLNGTTRAILRRRLSPAQKDVIEAVPGHLRSGALWRTLKFNHPWPRSRRPQLILHIEPETSDPS